MDVQNETMRRVAADARTRDRAALLAKVAGLAGLLTVLVIGAGSAALASPTARCAVSCSQKTAGVCAAPAYVHVDCTATTDSDSNVRPFHDLRYHIEYGDTGASGAGTWANSASGASRNEEFSPIGAHVYESPGTFTIRASVEDSNGVSSSWSGTVSVVSEDTAWTAANTRCVSRSGNFTGCPASVTDRVTSSTGDYDATVQVSAGKRTLFRCGESFTASGDPRLSDARANGSLVGGFGSCAGNPVNVTWGADGSLHTGSVLSGWRFRDISYTATSTGTGASFFNHFAGGGVGVLDFLLLRVKTLNVGVCSHITTAGPESTWNERVAFVDYECTCTRANDTRGWHLLFHSTRNGALMGNRWNGSSVSQNGMRTMGLNRVLFAHNTLLASNGAGLSMQFRNSNNETGRTDQYVVIRDNRIHDDGREGYRTIALCYAHDCGAPGDPNHKMDYIIEGNRISYGNSQRSSVINPIFLEVNRASVRNNIIDLRGLGTTGGANTQILIHATMGPPVDVDIYNNTLVRAGTGTGNLYVCSSTGGSGHRCRNNLAYDVDSRNEGLTSGTFMAASNNLHLNGPVEGCPFRGRDGACTLSAPGLNMNFDEFQIRPSGGSRALVVNQGFTFPEATSGRRSYVYMQAFPGCRGLRTGGPDALWDVGAHEAGASTCTSSPGPAALEPPILLEPL